MNTRPAVLIVDDDALILRVIERVLQPYYDIVTATSVASAQEILNDDQSFAVIVSDLRMPDGNGVELLQYARTRFPDMTRVLFSGAAELSDARAAINEGQVFRLLTKPFEVGAMRQALDAAVEQSRLITAERVLLEDTLQGSIKALTDILAIVQPMAFGRAIRMRQHVAELADRIGLTCRWDVEVAALLSKIGCVSLDADTLSRWYHGQELTMEECAHVDRLPEIAEALIADIPRLGGVRTILRRQYEPFDANGLPIGAAIVAIVRDFDELITEGKEPEHALATMDGRKGRYSFDLLQHFREIREVHSSNDTVQQMLLSQVAESMVFAADVYSENDLLLTARGQRVTPVLLSRIRMQSFATKASTEVRMIVPKPSAGNRLNIDDEETLISAAHTRSPQEMPSGQ